QAAPNDLVAEAVVGEAADVFGSIARDGEGHAHKMSDIGVRGQLGTGHDGALTLVGRHHSHAGVVRNTRDPQSRCFAPAGVSRSVPPLPVGPHPFDPLSLSGEGKLSPSVVPPLRVGPHPFDPLSLRERGNSVRPSFPLSAYAERGTGGEDLHGGEGREAV